MSSSARVRLGLLLVALFAALTGTGACNRSEAPAAPKPKAPATAAPAAPAAAAKSEAAPDLTVVKGRWLRPDGDYVLQIGEIDANGRAEAAYFNPNPIRIAWARVTAEGGALRVTAELRDTNYPGCLYKLAYDPGKKTLSGTYFQATQQQTYDVTFVRIP